jgi:predicted kinase
MRRRMMNKMAQMILMCGLPRSGKTTWAKDNRKSWVDDSRPDKFIISADALRQIVYNQRYWQDGETLMWSIHDIILKVALFQGIDIIIDECNISKKRRSPLIKIAKNYGYEVYCVYLTTSWVDCIDRANKDNDLEIIPIIERMSNNFEEPEYEEGFDEILFKYEEVSKNGK